MSSAGIWISLFFLDDILVYSKNEKEHEEHLRLTLKLLREHQLYVKLTVISLSYFGHLESTLIDVIIMLM